MYDLCPLSFFVTFFSLRRDFCPCSLMVVVAVRAGWVVVVVREVGGVEWVVGLDEDIGWVKD